MVRCVMVISTFLGPNVMRFTCCHFRAQKVAILRAHPFNAPPNDVARLKTIKYKHHINIRYIRILCT